MTPQIRIRIKLVCDASDIEMGLKYVDGLYDAIRKWQEEQNPTIFLRLVGKTEIPEESLPGDL